MKLRNDLEHQLMNEIRLYSGEHNWICLRINVGKVKTWEGTYFDTGLPNGYPDLTILRFGEVVYVETKVKPNKPSDDQIRFIYMLHRRGFKAFVAYTLDEFIKKVNWTLPQIIEEFNTTYDSRIKSLNLGTLF